MKTKTAPNPVPLDQIVDVDGLIAALGGPAFMSEAMVRSNNTVKAWLYRHSIPSREWPAVIVLAENLGFIGVDADFLLALHENSPASVSASVGSVSAASAA